MRLHTFTPESKRVYMCEQVRLSLEMKVHVFISEDKDIYLRMCKT